MDLNGRKHQILTAVIRTYIRTGEPVGSKSLLEAGDLNVSSATIRNEMSDLEKMGYLVKPHTSSGRIPSNDGYRYYVRTSLENYALTPQEMHELLLPSQTCGLDATVREACARLAEFTECTTFAVTPTCHDGIFTFEVLPAGKRMLAILAVGQGGSVKTGFAKTERDATPDEAAKLAEILNMVLSRFPVEQIGTVRMMLLESELRRNCPEFGSVLETVRNLIAQIKSYELTIGGSSNLLAYPEFSDIGTARLFIDALSEREQIMDAMLNGREAGGLRIRIGDENGVFRSGDASIIAVDCDAKIPLVFGLIGPKRMDYARMAAGCRYLVQALKAWIDEEY